MIIHGAPKKPLPRHMRRMLFVFVLATASGAAMASFADVVLQPLRPLSTDECISRSVGLADGICQATVVAFVDSSRQMSDGIWVDDAQLLLRPLRWFSGAHGKSMIRVGVESSALEYYRQLVVRGQLPANGIFFLVHAPQKSALPEFANAWPHSPMVKWLLLVDPFGCERGMLETLVDPIVAPQRVSDELNRQKLESLAQEADAVIVGTPIKDQHMRAGATQSYYWEAVTVDSVIVGSIPTDRIIIRGPTPADLPGGTTLMFLRSDGGNQYSIAVPAAGSRRIRNGQVTRLDLSVSEVVRRIRAARRGVEQ